MDHLLKREEQAEELWGAAESGGSEQAPHLAQGSLAKPTWTPKPGANLEPSAPALSHWAEPQEMASPQAQKGAPLEEAKGPPSQLDDRRRYRDTSTSTVHDDNLHVNLQYVSGHGTFAPLALEEMRSKNPRDRRFYEDVITVPEGTTVTFWNPDRSELMDNFGADLERGGGNLAQALKGRQKAKHQMEVFGPGAKLKNYILAPGKNLSMAFNPSGNTEYAKEPQTLGEILYRHRGKNVQWMACREESDVTTRTLTEKQADLMGVDDNGAELGDHSPARVNQIRHRYRFQLAPGALAAGNGEVRDEDREEMAKYEAELAEDPKPGRRAELQRRIDELKSRARRAAQQEQLTHTFHSRPGPKMSYQPGEDGTRTRGFFWRTVKDENGNELWDENGNLRKVRVHEKETADRYAGAKGYKAEKFKSAEASQADLLETIERHESGGSAADHYRAELERKAREEEEAKEAKRKKREERAALRRQRKREQRAEQSAEATAEQSAEATAEQSAEATAALASGATAEQSSEPSAEQSVEPTAELASEATAEQSGEPTSEPKAELTDEPIAPKKSKKIKRLKKKQKPLIE